MRIGVKYLKATGVTRKIDELGRIVIPKEIRRNLGIRDGESLEIFLDDDAILLKKHNQMHNFLDIGTKLVNIITSLVDIDLLITDREKVICTSEKYQNFLNQDLDAKLISLIERYNLDQYDREVLGTKPRAKKSSIDNIETSIALNTNNLSTHIVQKGDTLYSIAKKYNTTVALLQEKNNLKDSSIAIGQKLKVQ